MNYLKKILTAYLIIFISFLLCSCNSPKHLTRYDVIYKDDNFSSNHLISHGAIIGGIASKEISFSNEERVKYGSLLSTILTEHRTAVNFITTSQLMDKIGKESYFAIMNQYDVEQKLMGKDMRVIRDSIPEIAYIIPACIKNETASNTSYTEDTANDEGKYKTVNESTRSLTVEFQIYDVFQEKMVQNTRIFDEARRTGTSYADNSGGVVMDDLIFGGFRRVEHEDVLDEIYEKFAMALLGMKN
jgi:hypothetical protein